MTTYARKVNNRAVDVTTNDPSLAFHPDIAAQFITVPDGTVNGSIFASGAWSNPTPAPAPLPVYSTMEPLDFYLAFTVPERIAIKASTNPGVMEFWDTYERTERQNKPINPNHASVGEALALLRSENILTSDDRIDQIRAGVPQ